ncbi:MAG: hypothetical protein HYT38_02785 [Candidatus Sungbacteria bacterium]|uniref:DUF2680 domain-containing protein n=1 Tax=Candidatus Sungiibacteriota bacterium TaxID=2750080 RepID=A0A931YE20_9BACT|nr:hypothetical protein [Candidatus Sungbacteria bacterium]MBI2466147.1 hypothetical protein [Candidatus Sungbacteria bacterium]
MNKKLAYLILPVLGLAAAGAVSAHGLRGGLGLSASPDEIANQHQAMFQNQAQILGLSVDEIKNAWAEGKSPKDLMSEKNISTEQVQTRIKEMQTSQLKTQLKTLIEKGVITQAQADKHLQVMENRIKNKSGHPGFKFNRGFMW